MIDSRNLRRITNSDINRAAEDFLQEHSSYNSIPVDIERIVEFDLGIDIIPLPGLRNMFREAGYDMDAFIASDFSSISIDQFICDHRENRYRFTLAHEVGHMMLHSEYYEQLSFDSLTEWASTIIRIPNSTLAVVEQQANEFAGRALVPRQMLHSRFADVYDNVESSVLVDYPGLDADYPYAYLEQVQQAVIATLAEIFAVSVPVMRIRLEREGLVERTSQGTL